MTEVSSAMPDKNKRSRMWSYGSSSVVSTLFFVGILIFIALIAQQHPWRLDFTESGTYTLAEQTRNLLKSLEQPVEIKGFFPTSSAEEQKAKDLLDTYRYYSPKLSYTFIDPDRQPDVARRYEIRNYGTLVLEGYGKKQPVSLADEQNITNGLLKLISKDQKKVYFLTGHGERSSASTEKRGYSSVRSALEKENYLLEELNLMQKGEVPADAAMVIVGGPEKPLFPEEMERLGKYLDSGGRLIVLLDPFQDGGLRDFLKARGIELRDDIIIDESVGIFGGNYLMPLAAQYGVHKITENFQLVTFYPEARSIGIMDPLPPGIQAHVLASTSEKSWAETNLKLLEKEQKAGLDLKEDLAGPVPLVVLVEVNNSKPARDAAAKSSEGKGASKGAGSEKKDPAADLRQGILLVGGDSDFASNAYFGLSGNADFFLNMVNFLAGDETLITIERREKEGRPLLLTRSQSLSLMWVLGMVPVVVILCGLLVYRARRSQR